MLLTEMLSRDEMKELMTSFNKISTLHPRKEKPNVQEIKETVQEMARVANEYSAREERSDSDTSWPKALIGI